MTSETYPPPTLARRAAAWGVHLFTATGAVWALLTIQAIFQEQWKLSFLWIVLAVLVDGVDGYLARYFKTKVYAPELDGGLLDNILDYLNYAFIPALFLIYARLLPELLAWPTAFLLILASIYQFSQVDAKTEDNYFKGFPCYWNVLVLYLMILNLNPWFNWIAVAVCIVLVFVPIKYIYPSRTSRRWTLYLVLVWAWAISGIIGLFMYPNMPSWLVIPSLAFVVFYLIDSLMATYETRKNGLH